MSIPDHPPRRERRLRPLHDSQPRHISPVTEIQWGRRELMPFGADGQRKGAQAYLDEDGTLVIVVSEGLSAVARRKEMGQIYAALRGEGAGHLSAVTIITLGVFRFAARHLMRAAGAHLLPLAAAGTVIAGGAITGGVVIATSHHGPAGPPVGSPAWHRQHPVHVKLPEKPLSYLGAYEAQNELGSYAGMETFAATCGRQPNVALDYSGWFQKFPFALADAAARHGAIPMIQINPEIDPGATPISLAAIANGAYDNYLISYADQAATYHKAVIIGFGHEMNGWWYPWGARHQDPAAFVAAWRHIVTVFRTQGAYNITWLWSPNVITGANQHLADWWPGDNYVTWVGIDGYYRHPDDTWSNVFDPTIAVIRQFTGDPILIAETAIGPVGTEPWQLNDMYAAIRHSGYLGLVWFDEDKPGLQYRLEGDAAAIAVFRQETQAWRLTHQRGPAAKTTGAKRLMAEGLSGLGAAERQPARRGVLRAAHRSGGDRHVLTLTHQVGAPVAVGDQALPGRVAVASPFHPAKFSLDPLPHTQSGLQHGDALLQRINAGG